TSTCSAPTGRALRRRGEATSWPVSLTPPQEAAVWPAATGIACASTRGGGLRWTYPQPAPFFFQAEDGIRDFHVTGVQTCALPISPWWPTTTTVRARPSGRRASSTQRSRVRPATSWSTLARSDRKRVPLPAARTTEIGRASCRERAWSAEGAVAGQTTTQATAQRAA